MRLQTAGLPLQKTEELQRTARPRQKRGHAQKVIAIKPLKSLVWFGRLSGFFVLVKFGGFVYK